MLISISPLILCRNRIPGSRLVIQIGILHPFRIKLTYKKRLICPTCPVCNRCCQFGTPTAIIVDRNDITIFSGSSHHSLHIFRSSMQSSPQIKQLIIYFHHCLFHCFIIFLCYDACKLIIQGIRHTLHALGIHKAFCRNISRIIRTVDSQETIQNPGTV